MTSSLFEMLARRRKDRGLLPEIEQVTRRVPEKFAAIPGIRKEVTGEAHQRPIVLEFLGTQIRPI
jgi:hypothetical protein